MEASNVYGAVTEASQANAALCVANIGGKMTTDLITRCRRRGIYHWSAQGPGFKCVEAPVKR